MQTDDQITPADGLADELETLGKMLDDRRRQLASCERMLELLQPEWDKFEARDRHDVYVARDYANHTSAARRHRKEIAALEYALRIQPDTNAREDALREAAHIASEHEPKLLSEGDIITAEGARTAADAIAEKILVLINNPTGGEEQ